MFESFEFQLVEPTSRGFIYIFEQSRNRCYGICQEVSSKHGCELAPILPLTRSSHFPILIS